MGNAGFGRVKTEISEVSQRGIAFGGTGESVLEGQSTLLTVTVKNTSTQDGVAVAASLTTKINVSTSDNTVVLAQVTLTDNYVANGTKTYGPYTITAPLGKGGQSLGANVGVYAPNGVNIANGTATEPIVARAAGSVGLGIIWYDGLAGWESLYSGRQVPTGKNIYLAPQWINTSSFNIVGHIDLTLDGTALSATLNQDREAAPNNGWYVQFTPVVLSAGIHTFVVKLSSGGQVLDTKTFTLVVGTETAVAVSSIPSGASIYINGTYVGQTPITISLVSGTYTITFMLTGYQDYTGQFTLTGEYTSTSLGVTLAPIPPPATPHLTFGQLTGVTNYLWGFAQPFLSCTITNNSGVAIVGRDILAFARYTSPQSGLPVEYSGSITDTVKSYGVPVYGLAPGLITLQPGASIDIAWAPNFSIPKDVVNSLWLFDTVTGDKSNVIYLP